MPVPSKHDNNVPFLPGKSRYSLITTEPTWIYHSMATGQTLNGKAPRVVANPATPQADPSCRGGRADYSGLADGGLFTSISNRKTPIIIEAIDNPGNATLTLVDAAGNAIRNFPTSFPCKISSFETMKAVGGGTAGKVGFLLRFDAEKIL